jgi:hypothetical protein
MQDILMFLITFFVIMLAFSCGVSYMFNYLTDGTGSTSGTGSSTGGVFTYFFWVLLQVSSPTASTVVGVKDTLYRGRQCTRMS